MGDEAAASARWRLSNTCSILVGMARRPHPRLAAAHARTAVTMRQAAHQLREQRGPIKAEARDGLARLLEAVADRHDDAGTYVWGGASAVANALVAEPMDVALRNVPIRRVGGFTP